MINRMLQAAIGVMLFAGLLAASPLCTNGNMNGYQAPGFSCDIGTIQFSGFDLSITETNVGFGGTQALPANNITVNIQSGSFGFGVNPTTWYNQDDIVFTISFQALETDLNRRINSLGSSFNDNIVQNDQGTATLLNSARCTAGCNSTISYAASSVTAGDGGAGTQILGGTGVVGPISLVLQVNMNLPASDSGNLAQVIHFSAASATIADTTFHGGLPPNPVPEPTTIGLCALGLLATGLRRRFAR